jgi:hypothetical protein
VEEKGGPGHDPDEKKSPEEIEGNGVIVSGDAEIEIAEEMLVNKVEPEPAVDVAVSGERDLPVMIGEAEAAGIALGGISTGDENVPGGGHCQEDESAGDGMELA